jgi:GT2 family glycosyltransferase
MGTLYRTLIKNPPMDLIVNIATAGRPDLLKWTLHSLGKCLLPAGYKETIVVENGTRAGAEDVVRSGPPSLNLRYLHEPQSNKSAALNRALAAFRDCLIFFTDDDVRLDPRVLQAYSDAAEKVGPGKFFGGPADVDYESPPPTWLRQYLPKSATGWQWKWDPNCVNVPEFLGFNWAAFASDLRAVGGFNTDRGPGSPSGSTGQESDMQHRLLNRGLHGVYVPHARVWHFVPGERCSLKWAIDRNFRHGVEEGTLAAAEPQGPCGLPPWRITNHYLKGIVRELMWSFSTSPELRFRARHRRSYDRGLMHGIRCQREATTVNYPAPRRSKAWLPIPHWPVPLGERR